MMTSGDTPGDASKPNVVPSNDGSTESLKTDVGKKTTNPNTTASADAKGVVHPDDEKPAPRKRSRSPSPTRTPATLASSGVAAPNQPLELPVSDVRSTSDRRVTFAAGEPVKVARPDSDDNLVFTSVAAATSNPTPVSVSTSTPSSKATTKSDSTVELLKEAVSKLKTSPLGFSSISDQSHPQNPRYEDRVLESLFVGAPYIPIQSGTAEDAAALDLYFDALIHKLALSDALKQKLKKDYEQNKTASGKSAYLKQWLKQLETIISESNPELNSKIQTTRDYDSAFTWISGIATSMLGHGQPCWNFQSHSHEIFTLDQLTQKIADINFDSFNFDSKIKIFYCLEMLVGSFGPREYLPSALSPKDFVTLVKSSEKLILKYLKNIQADMLKNDKKIDPNLYEHFENMEKVLKKMSPELSENSQETKEILATLQNILSTMPLTDETRHLIEYRKSLSASSKPSVPASSRDTKAPANPKVPLFSERLSRLDATYDDLKDNGNTSTQSIAAHTEPTPPKKPWISDPAAKKLGSSTAYESPRMASIEEYHKTLDLLAGSITKISAELKDKVTVISSPEKDKHGARQLTIQYEDKPQEKITHSLDENKRLVINIHPADGDRPIIFAMREAVAGNLRLQLKPNANRDLKTLLKVFHASLLYSEGYVKIHQDDLALLDNELKTKPTSEVAKTYQALLALKENPAQLKARTTRKLGQLESLPEEDQKKRLAA